MGKVELKPELEAMVRKKLEPPLARKHERQQRLDSLSDEEWWEEQMQLSAQNPLFRALMERDKAYLIDHRFDHLQTQSGDGMQPIIDAEVERLMPILVQVRSEMNEDGPLTEAQYNACCFRRIQTQMAEQVDTLKGAVSRQTDVRRSELMTQLATNAELAMQDMSVFTDPNVTQ
jgi:hypothetical protein